MGHLAFFDCNCTIGRQSLFQGSAAPSLEDLKADMQLCGIRKALVRHSLAKEYDPARGNALLMEEIGGQDEFVPCWAALPHHTGEMPPGPKLVAEMKDCDVGAAILFPKTQGFLLDEQTCGPLLDAFEENGIPVLLEIEEADWQKVHGICSNHPSVSLVVLSTGYRCTRELLPLFERHANLMVDISLYPAHRLIESICERFGAHRLLFGTGYPELAPGAVVGAVAFADIPGAQRELIAGGNLERLLEGKGK